MDDPSNRGRLPRGVVWDGRRGTYRAKIMVQGVQTWLGSFETAEEASAAYERIKAPRRESGAGGERRKGVGAEYRARIWEQARDRWRGVFNGQPEPVRFEVQGEEFGDTFDLPRGPHGAQVYEFLRKDWRRFRGKMWALWVWRAQCAREGCGEAFEVMTPASLDGMGVPSAYCKAHRRPGRPRRVSEATTLPESPEMAVLGHPGGAAGASGAGGEGDTDRAALLAEFGDLV